MDSMTPTSEVTEKKDHEVQSVDIGSGDGPLMSDTGNSGCVLHENEIVTPSRNWMKDSFAERSTSLSQLRQAELAAAVTVAEKVSIIELISNPDLDMLTFADNSKSKLYNSEEDEGESSISICTDPSNTSEDELTRKQRLSVLKALHESDKFMDQLRNARTDRVCGVGDNGSPALGQGDVKLEKVFKSIEDLEAMYKTSGHNKSTSSLLVQTSEMSEVTCPNMTSHASQTRMTADLIAGKDSPSKASDLNAWVEKGTWMKSTENVADKKNIKYADTSLDFKHSIANSSVQSSVQPMPSSENADSALEKVCDVNTPTNDVEECLDEPPQEFVIDEGGRKCFKCLIA